MRTLTRRPERGGPIGGAAPPLPKKDLAGGSVSGESASCPAPPPPSSLKAQASSWASTAANSWDNVGGSSLTWERTFHFAELKQCLDQSRRAPYSIWNTHGFNLIGAKLGRGGGLINMTKRLSHTPNNVSGLLQEPNNSSPNLCPTSPISYPLVRGKMSQPGGGSPVQRRETWTRCLPA